MHFVIMGCGRVGASLATSLEEFGHSVAVIDQNPAAFQRLGPNFQGQTVKGVGFDRDALAQAGIETAVAFAAVSSGDNSNILAARVARETFGVRNVVARIYDPGRAEIYQRLGIATVATVKWASDQVLRRLLPAGGLNVYRDTSGKIVLSEVSFHDAWVGTSVADIEAALPVRVSFLTRLGEGLLPLAGTVLQDGDLLHVCLQSSDAPHVERALANAPVKPEA